MNLYFSPLACSMSSRIALYEAGAPAEFTQVNTKTKHVADGSDFFAINPLGQVPALRTDDGWLLTENTAILPYIADCFPEAQLAPADRASRARLQQWLGFISTELHKAVFVPLLDASAPEGAKAYAREKTALRMDFLQDHLAQHDFVLDQFSVADAYLVTILNWAVYSGVDLVQWPAVAAYFQRLLQRPSVTKAFGEEMALYKEELQRRAQA
ncbi:glutathione binding-like protein [Dyella subtropica]|uniref:glutathione binding-like protein n=1 Tax=Dyella subtropica TaxID=2992127 RepID=UPI0022554C4B|nr:glutathione binding-like protein [Dyella subtropica]